MRCGFGSCGLDLSRTRNEVVRCLELRLAVRSARAKWCFTAHTARERARERERVAILAQAASAQASSQCEGVVRRGRGCNPGVPEGRESASLRGRDLRPRGERHTTRLRLEGPVQGHSKVCSSPASAAYPLHQGEIVTRYLTVLGGLRKGYLYGGIRDYLRGRQKASSV